MAAIRDLENFNRVACCGGSFTVFFCSPRPAAAVIADLPVSYVPGDDALCRVRARHRCCVARRRIALRPAAPPRRKRVRCRREGATRQIGVDLSRMPRQESVSTRAEHPCRSVDADFSMIRPCGERSLRKSCPKGESGGLQAELVLCVAQTTRHQRKSPRGRERVGSSTVSQSSV